MLQNYSKKSLSQKVISALVALCIMAGLILPYVPVSVDAVAPTNYTTITADFYASVSISSGGSVKYFKFVPTQSGTYRFYSSNQSGDPLGALLNASGTTLASDDDGAGNRNFTITLECSANTTYYIAARMYGSGTGSYRLNVQTISVSGPSAPAPTGSVVEINTSGSHALFNSGATSTRGYAYSTSGNGGNVNCSSYTNGGYDIYGDSPSARDLTRRLGLSFLVDAPVKERASLTIYAYDIDEESNQIDDVYLVNDATGQRQFIGNLSGRDSSWSTSTFSIDPDYFVVGQTYHIEVDICKGGWWTWVRRVSLEMTVGDYVPTTILDYSFQASINNNGRVSTNLALTTNENITYYLEYTATIRGEQKGGTEGQTITATPQGSSLAVAFDLEYGSPVGTYDIKVILKDSYGNTKATYQYSAGYAYSAVSYDANGGSQNLPTDMTTYSSGDLVTVKFDYVPSRYGYVFLGWSTDRNATVPTYTESGTKTFTIGSGDVTLYAVWGSAAHTHSFTQTSRTEPGCTTFGEAVYTCSCGQTRTDLLEPTQHNYEITLSQEATCTQDGFIEFTCRTSGCGATKRQILNRLNHDFGRDSVCDHCGFVRDNHDHQYDTQTVAPTCSSMGYTEYTCSCGYSYRDAYVEPSRHHWNNGEVTIAATCTRDGLMTYTCQDCHTTKTVIIKAEHDWNVVITRAKTCTTDGSMTKTCNVCGKVEIEAIPAGHDWDEGVQTLAPTCTTPGSKTCTCRTCGAPGEFAIDKLGHSYVNGICTRCGGKFIDHVTPSSHPIYGMYFEIDDILSDYGPSLIDEYGLMLDYNQGATLEKVAVYLTQDGTMWRRCIAVKGTNIQFAIYVPYLSYQSDIKYTGLNHNGINIFRLQENADGIWCYSNYATIGVNLEDAYGNLLLSLYDIGQAGAQTRIFDDLEEMIDWLNGGCFDHTPGDWIVDEPASCAPGSQHKECSVCHKVLQTQEIPPVAAHTPGDWIVDVAPSTTQKGSRHKECTACHANLGSEEMPVLAKLTIDCVEASAGHTVRVTIDIQNNPGIIGAILTIQYDPALKLVGVELGSAWSGLSFTRPSSFSSPCNFVWDGLNGADSTNGTIIVLIFELPANADAGTVYQISASYTSGNMVNGNLESVDVEINSGSITLIETLGDVNGDGIVDVADVITLRRYLSGGYQVTIDTSASDVNKDGQITIADVILLRRLITG